MDNVANTYIVQQGDTLSEIAEDNGTDVQTLTAVNQISDIDFIVVGQTLKFQAQDLTPAVTYSPATVTEQNLAPVVAESTAHTTPVQAEVTSAVAPQETQAVATQDAPADATPVAQAQQSVAPVAGGTTYNQFIANGGTDAMWNYIVMPESGGNPDVTSPNGYHGLGQTKESWGYGDVATQTQGMVNYANNRYGSVDGAIAFRQANGWW